MIRLTQRPFFVIAAVLFLPGTALAQSAEDRSLSPTIEQVSTHMGEMSVTVGATDIEVDDALRFEPYQQLEEMFLRDDVVYVMRHGPTNWSKLDEKNVAPTDCDNQRIMSDAGIEHMRDLGTLMASNDILPAQIVVSEWCRNQQTLDHMLEGIARVDPAAAAEMPVETDGGLNLLLSLQGAKSVTPLAERISNWDGHPTRRGPLLLVTHYTNIEELTQFRVFEGEILVLDPKRDNQVLGYLRLRSAGPDVGHFKDALESPLNAQGMALDMVSRYYQALNSGDDELIRSILADQWVVHGMSPSLPERDADNFLAELAEITDGLSDAKFEVDDLHVADEVVTVIGTITGVHTGEIFGYAPTDKKVAFGGIAVHRVKEGAIAESWQMADRLSFVEQISGE